MSRFRPAYLGHGPELTSGRCACRDARRHGHPRLIPPPESAAAVYVLQELSGPSIGRGIGAVRLLGRFGAAWHGYVDTSLKPVVNAEIAEVPDDRNWRHSVGSASATEG